MALAASVRAAAGLLATGLLLAIPATATVRSGTWGVANVPYQAGVVCTEGSTTSPLARWDFGDPNPDFLLRGVTSNGLRDSAQLPVAGTANRITTAVQPGQYGFTSADDIATYAALLDRYGGGHAAAVALALLEHSDPAQVPGCGSPGAASALLARAQAQAGPYQVSVSVAHRPAVLGSANAVTAQVTGRSGAGAPGVPVSINASAGVFAGGASSTTAVTGADGRATAAFTAPDSTADRRVTFEASASVAVSVEAVTATPQVGQTAPYAPVAFADPPATARGRTAVAIDLTADPHITVSLPAGAVVTNRAMHLGAQITGMRGHTGEAQITASGPEPLDKSSLCADVAAGADGADSDTAYDSGDIDISTDEQVTANTWTPAKPGCYVIRSHVVTTNAVPEAEARGQTLVVTVLDSASTLSTSGTLVATGPLSAKLQLDHSYGLSGTARVRVLGPMRPADNDCTSLDWSHAPTAATAARPVHGDDAYAIRTSAVGDPGCYLFAGDVDLSVPDAGTVRVPIEVAADSRIAYVLHPTLQLTGDETATVSPDPVGTHITVDGTFGQPGHLRVAMVHAPGGTFGCARVDYSHGTRGDLGPAVAFTGDGTYAVRSGPTRTNGCYSLVPILVMDANTSITATGTAGAEGSTIVAGVDPGGNAEQSAPSTGASSPFGTDVWTSVLVYVLLAVLALGLLLRLVLAERNPWTRPAPGLDTMLHDPGPQRGRRFRVARAARHREDRG